MGSQVLDTTEQLSMTTMKTKRYFGNSLVIQWLGFHVSTAKGPGSIAGWGTGIPQAARSGQKKRSNLVILGPSFNNSL